MIMSMIFEFSVPDYIILDYLYTSFGPGIANEKRLYHTSMKMNIHVHVFADSGLTT